jgi:hypothetical protein
MLQMSTFDPYLLLLSSSGAAYAGLPHCVTHSSLGIPLLVPPPPSSPSSLSLLPFKIFVERFSAKPFSTRIALLKPKSEATVSSAFMLVIIYKFIHHMSAYNVGRTVCHINTSFMRFLTVSSPMTYADAFRLTALRHYGIQNTSHRPALK